MSSYGTAIEGQAGGFETAAVCGTDGQFTTVTCIGLSCGIVMVSNSNFDDSDDALDLVVGETAEIVCNAGRKN